MQYNKKWYKGSDSKEIDAIQSKIQCGSEHYKAMNFGAMEFQTVQVKATRFNAVRFKVVGFKVMWLKGMQFEAVQLEGVRFKAIQFIAIQLKATLFKVEQFKSMQFEVFSDQSPDFASAPVSVSGVSWSLYYITCWFLMQMNLEYFKIIKTQV